MTDDLENRLRSVLSRSPHDDLPKACADAVRPLLTASAVCITDATALLPALTAACEAQAALIADAQMLLAKHVQPGGFSKRDVIDKLLGLLDGPQALAARDLRAVATALVKGESE